MAEGVAWAASVASRSGIRALLQRVAEETRKGGGGLGGKVVAVSPNKQAKSAQKCWQTVSISISGEKLMATFLSTFQFIFARFFLELTTLLVVAAIEKLLPYADDACCLNGGIYSRI